MSASGCTFAGSRASNGNGGAIDNRVDGSGGQALVSLGQTDVGPRPHFLNDGNQAKNGGGIANDGTNGTASVSLQSHTSVHHNKASIDGGGVGVLSIGGGSTVYSNTPDNVS